MFGTYLDYRRASEVHSLLGNNIQRYNLSIYYLLRLSIVHHYRIV